MHSPTGFLRTFPRRKESKIAKDRRGAIILARRVGIKIYVGIRRRIVPMVAAAIETMEPRKV